MDARTSDHNFGITCRQGSLRLLPVLLSSLLISSSLFGLLLLSRPQTVLAAANSTLNFQTKIVQKTTGLNVTNGTPSCVQAGADTCDFRVSIHTDSVGGTQLWTETHSNVEIGATGGVINLSLNSIAASWGFTWGADDTIYLQVEFDDDGNGDFSSPETFARKLISSVPFAYYADEAGTAASINGFTDNDFVQLVPGSVQTVTSAATPLIYIDEDDAGNSPNLIQLLVGGVDAFTVTNAGNGLFAGNVSAGTTTSTAFINAAAATTGQASLRLISSAGTNPSSPNSGDVWWNGTNLNFRTASTTVDLLASSLTAFVQNGNSFGGAAVLGTNDNNALQFETNNSVKLTILAGGNVGIGDTNPANLLTLQSTTTPQFRIAYDGSNYVTTSVTSDGSTSFQITGNGFTGFSFNRTTNVSSSASSCTGCSGLRVNFSSSGGDENFGARINSDAFNTQTNAGGLLVNAGLESSSIPNIFGVLVNVGTPITSGAVTNTGDNIYGARLQGTWDSSGDLSNYYGLYAADLGLPNSGIITTAYGLYLEELTATNSYGLYIEGAATYAIWSDSGVNRFDGNVLAGTTTSTAFLNIAASTTAQASLRLISSAGTNPSSPNSGDVWWNGTNLNFRTASTTVDLLAASLTAFVQNGNSFGGTAVLGTNDTFGLELETDGSTRVLIDATGNIFTNGGVAGNSAGFEMNSSLLIGGDILMADGTGVYWWNSGAGTPQVVFDTSTLYLGSGSHTSTFIETQGLIRVGGTLSNTSARVNIVAATTALAQLNLLTSAGVNPSAPTSGDLWWNGTNLNFRTASSTIDLLTPTIAADSLDFVDFEDTMDLDANLTLNQSTNTWIQNFSGTTTTGYSYSANSLTSGTGFHINTSAANITGSLVRIAHLGFGGIGSPTGNLLELAVVPGIGFSASMQGLYILNTGGGNSIRIDDQASDTTPFILDAAGNMSVGGDISTSITSINLLNTTATTINFGGAATTIGIGISGASGTLDLMGGFGSTGCTVNGIVGNIGCTGQFVAVADGSSTTPRFTFSNGSTTGMYLSGTSLAFTTAGSNALVLNSAGNGTFTGVVTATDAVLSSTAPILRFTSTNDTSGARYTVDGTATIAHRFQYNGSTLLQINPDGISTLSGTLDIVESTTSPPLLVRNTNGTTSAQAAVFRGCPGTFSANCPLIRFQDGDVTQVGAITVTGAATVSYGSGSDARVKEGIINTQYTLSDLLAIQVRDYRFIGSSKEDTGFIAQELNAIYPHAVIPGNADTIWTVDYGKVTPLIVKGVQELNTKVEANKADIAQLRVQIADFDTRINFQTARINELESRINAISSSNEITVNYTLPATGSFTELIISGKLNVTGQLLLSNKNIGKATIAVGETEKTIQFAQSFPVEPIVIAVPNKSSVTYSIQQTSATGFKIVLDTALEEEVQFNWFVSSNSQ